MQHRIPDRRGFIIQ